MARRQIIFDDRLEERVKNYCDKNGLTFTTFAHMAISHYLEHLSLSKDLESIFKSFITDKLKEKKGERQWVRGGKSELLIFGVAFPPGLLYKKRYKKSVPYLIKGTHYSKTNNKNNKNNKKGGETKNDICNKK